MIRRRASGAGIKTLIGCHTFRATGITAYLKGGGKLEVAQQMAAHESASAINPATDDLGTLGGLVSSANGINAAGQVVGFAWTAANKTHAFRTAANSAINPATDDLGTLGGDIINATGINVSGQVVGTSNLVLGGSASHGFRTAANSAINPATDDLGKLGGDSNPTTIATGINAAGQVVGYSEVVGNPHAFRTAANSAINPVTDDLGTLGGGLSYGFGINASGQVVGYSTTPAQVIHAFLYSGGVMYDLNTLIQAGSGWTIETAYGINDAGQIAATSAAISGGFPEHALRLDPVPDLPHPHH